MRTMDRIAGGACARPPLHARTGVPGPGSRDPPYRREVEPEASASTFARLSRWALGDMRPLVAVAGLDTPTVDAILFEDAARFSTFDELDSRTGFARHGVCGGPRWTAPWLRLPCRAVVGRAGRVQTAAVAKLGCPSSAPCSACPSGGRATIGASRVRWRRSRRHFAPVAGAAGTGTAEGAGSPARRRTVHGTKRHGGRATWARDPNRAEPALARGLAALDGLGRHRTTFPVPARVPASLRAARDERIQGAPLLRELQGAGHWRRTTRAILGEDESGLPIDPESSEQPRSYDGSDQVLGAGDPGAVREPCRQ
jgi:hypothetical protein